MVLELLAKLVHQRMSVFRKAFSFIPLAESSFLCHRSVLEELFQSGFLFWRRPGRLTQLVQLVLELGNLELTIFFFLGRLGMRALLGFQVGFERNFALGPLAGHNHFGRWGCRWG